MEQINSDDRSPANIGARDEARQIAQGVGIIFSSVQEMVDDIERKLLDEDKTESATKKP